MTKEQTMMLLGIISELYPRFIKAPTAMTIDIWHDMLGDLDFELAQVAVKKHTATSTFPPTVAEIRAAAVYVSGAQIPSEGEAWSNVMSAIRRYGFYRQLDALASLDDMTRKSVKAIGWGVLCTTEDIMATRAHFFKIYASLAARAQQNSVLPPLLQQRIAQMLPVDAVDAVTSADSAVCAVEATQKVAADIDATAGLAEISHIRDILRGRV